MVFTRATRWFLLLLAVPLSLDAQANPDSSRIEQRLDQVLAALSGMQQQLDASRQQINQLENQVRDLQSQLQASGNTADASALQQSVQQLQNDHDVLAAEVKQHDQTKVETASKFPLRVSGLVLFSSFLNNGAVDNIDLPILALPRTNSNRGSLAATLRQTVVGLEGRGPTVGGARTAGDVHVDFFGGTPYTGYTAASGLLRLRTAHVRLDWPNHSLVGAFDSPLIAPQKPTSYIGIGEPPLSWSGNLWIWSPQFQSLNQARLGPGTLHYDAALIDPASGTVTTYSGERQPDPSESSRQPGYESHVSYSIPLHDRSFTFGGGGYYSRQTYSTHRHVDAYAGTADWRLPFTQWLELSGALYRGRSLAGLGGGAFKDYVQNPDTYAVRGLDTEGGWAQLKWRITRQVEGNLMLGEDAAFSSELVYPDNDLPAAYSTLARNRTVIANLTYRPRSYFYITTEYRNIDSWPVTGHVNIAQSVGLATGYSF
jgi:hypothetical protein